MTFKINKRQSKGLTKQHYKAAKALRDFAEDNDFSFVPWDDPLTQRRTWTNLHGYYPNPTHGDVHDKFNLVLEHDKRGEVTIIDYSEVDGLSISVYVDDAYAFLDALGEKRWLSDDFDDWRWDQSAQSLAKKISNLPGVDKDTQEVEDPVSVFFGTEGAWA